MAGGIMMGWTIGEVLILTQPEARSWVEAAYFAAGLAMTGLVVALGRFASPQPLASSKG